MFRFFLDENVPRRIAERLRSEGHDVVEVTAQPFRGSPDDYLWRHASAEHRIFVTRDIGATALPRDPTGAQPACAQLHELSQLVSVQTS